MSSWQCVATVSHPADGGKSPAPFRPSPDRGNQQMTRKVLLTLIAPVLLAACGTPTTAGSVPSTSPVATASATPSPTATPEPTPTPAPTPTPVPPTAPPRVAPSVFVANNMALGAILVNAQGRTLYYFVPERGGRIICTGQCTNAWPPLFATSMAPK